MERIVAAEPLQVGETSIFSRGEIRNVPQLSAGRVLNANLEVRILPKVVRIIDIIPHLDSWIVKLLVK
jgi:hypothetical protein